MTLASADPPGAAGPSSRLMVLMFTDVVGSVRLKAELGLAAYARRLARHDALFRSIVAGTPGAEVRQDTGDGFYAAFATPSDAVAAGLRFQLGLRTAAATGGATAGDPKPLGVRVGIHLGQMEQVAPADAGGYAKLVGLGADLAARVMSLALPGQVLMTRAVFDDARLYVRAVPGPSAGDPAGPGEPAAAGDPAAAVPQWLAHGRYRLAGQDEPVDVYEAGVVGVSPLCPPPDSDKAKRFLGPDEEQTLGWRPAAGRDIPGRPGWHVDRKLGEGGFGEVWLGRNARTRTERVYKFCFDADRLRSLKRELTLFRLLREALGDRPDIAKLHDVRLDQPPFFLESDYSPLGDLADWARRQGGIDRVPLATRLELVARVADAVAAAHSVGVLHKDLKPSNILVYEAEDGGPRPRLADFGIGILTDRARLEGLRITAAGFSQSMLTANESSRTGTRLYAPPELLSGKPYTVQGDVYALGVLLYQIVVGDLARPLAPGWERDVADDLLREDVAACAEGDPARRLGSAAELADRLRMVGARRAARLASARAAARRRAYRWATVCAVLAVAGTLMYVIVRGLDGAARNRAVAQATVLQQTLAVQTARGIEGHYEAILTTMDLLPRADSEEEAERARIDSLLRSVTREIPLTSFGPPASRPGVRPAVARPRTPKSRTLLVGHLLGRQLEERVTHLFVVDRQPQEPPVPRPPTQPGTGASAMVVRDVFVSPSDSGGSTAEALVARDHDWLATAEGQSVSRFERLPVPAARDGEPPREGIGGYHLVALPYGSGGRNSALVVAAVPVAHVAERFLSAFQDDPTAGCVLVDETSTVMAASRPSLAGANVSAGGDPDLAAALDAARAPGGRSSSRVVRRFVAGDLAFERTLLTVEPIRVGERTWLAVLYTPVAGVEAVWGNLLKAVAGWSLLLGLATLSVAAYRSR